jgi:lipopolysaccharide transport system permease protein
VEQQSLTAEPSQARARASAAAAALWAGEPDTTLIRPSRAFFDLGLRSLWAYRELLFFLIWRDVKVRYKQTVVGLLWVVLQPVATMLIFTIIFSRLAKLPTPHNVPYPLFVFAGLLPWQLFSSGMMSVTASVVGSSSLISKVYFPRLLVPIASVVSGLVDFGASLLVLVVLMIHYRYVPGIQALAIPFFVLVAIGTALAIGLWLSMLNVRFRDVQYTIPFVTQMWLLLTPVAYASSVVPVRYRALLGLNPMTSVVDGFRWAFVGGAAPWDTSFTVSLIMVGLILVTGIVFFRRMEKTIVDLI